MNIRFATVADAADILAIYAPYIENTCISFEVVVPTLAEFEQRITNTLKQYPYLVGEVDGKIVGYAYGSRCGSRAAFDWSTELSIYLTPETHGKGYGKQLYQTLLTLLTAQGYRIAYGRIAGDNAGSFALHESLGFTLMGVQRNVGYKFDGWHDLVWYEKHLVKDQLAPPPQILSVEATKVILEELK